MAGSGRIFLRSIGVVRTELKEECLRRRSFCSRIVIDEEYEPALQGIESFSHLNVIFWMHGINPAERRAMKARPRGRCDMPVVGVLATRAPHRPNPIGLTVVELIEREGNVLKVKGLDALDGTPILDLKPYDYLDRVGRIRVPEWWRRLQSPRECG
ncbi:tRNA (N6-threonylcarbamoyladenosine(37)-N6)-methyltransferase TrmO [Candidatus Bathyarchaeota archaeon]|nr:tRNA (N6-threonylcarbamoyladenosine(37)-N6)-methyltransferase TrmO [Candidatus Bathyarchaeota archaeon]